MSTRIANESARRVSGCVTALLREQPFFGSLALRLPIRPDPSRETLASDGREIRYDPAWVSETGADYVKTAIARVVLACALKHHTRRGARDPGRWQRASQLVTHGLLRESGFALPDDAEAWDGISVEEAYDRLPEPDGESSQQPTDATGGAQGRDGASPPKDGDGNDGPGESDPEPHPPSGDNPEDPDTDAAPPSTDPSGTGEVMDSPAGDAPDSGGAAPPPPAAEEQAWDEAMHQALNLARAEGKLPGAVAETVEDAHRGLVDWRTALRRYMIDACRADYTWSRPNRRFIDSGLYLPSIHSDGMHSIAVFIDTSGSLRPDTLAAFWGAIRDLATEIRPETVIVLQIDTAVRDALEHDGPDLPAGISLKGRGGTDFRPGFEWLAERGIAPSVCVYLTDMLCSNYPAVRPSFPVVWCNWGDPPEDWNREPWGERIDIGAA